MECISYKSTWHVDTRLEPCDELVRKILVCNRVELLNGLLIISGLPGGYDLRCWHYPPWHPMPMPWQVALMAPTQVAPPQNSSEGSYTVSLDFGQYPNPRSPTCHSISPSHCASPWSSTITFDWYKPIGIKGWISSKWETDTLRLSVKLWFQFSVPELKPHLTVNRGRALPNGCYRHRQLWILGVRQWDWTTACSWTSPDPLWLRDVAYQVVLSFFHSIEAYHCHEILHHCLDQGLW